VKTASLTIYAIMMFTGIGFLITTAVGLSAVVPGSDESHRLIVQLLFSAILSGAGLSGIVLNTKS